MKFQHSFDCDVPVDYLFERASDFAEFEHRAKRAGATVQRLSREPFVPGFRWQIAGMLRGKPQQAEIELRGLIKPDKLRILAVSGGLNLDIDVRFIALSRRSSRVDAEFAASATTLRTRMMLHSMRLVRGRTSKRIKLAIGKALHKIEDDYYAKF